MTDTPQEPEPLEDDDGTDGDDQEAAVLPAEPEEDDGA